GIPDLREPQTAALERMTADLIAPVQSVNAARAALTKAAFAQPRSDAAIQAKADALAATELALANARADAFATLQASPARLAANQVAALIAAGGAFRGAPGGRGAQGAGGRGTIPNIKESQTAALMRLTTDIMPLTRSLTTARSALVAAALAEPPN